MTKIIYFHNSTCSKSSDSDNCAFSRIFQILTSAKICLDIQQNFEYPIKSLEIICSTNFHLVTHPSLSCPSHSPDFPCLSSSVSPYIPSPGTMLVPSFLYAPPSFHSHILSSSHSKIEPIIPLSCSGSPFLNLHTLPSCSKFFSLTESVDYSQCCFQPPILSLLPLSTSWI